jgi:hypothetical protein
VNQREHAPGAEIAVVCFHPIDACYMLSGRLQSFIPRKRAHFEEHILTLHTGCGYEYLNGSTFLLALASSQFAMAWTILAIVGMPASSHRDEE